MSYAHRVLKQVIAMKADRCSGMNWRRLPGRPRKKGMDTTDWRRNNNQLETDVAECRGLRSVDIVKSRRNGPQLSTRHDDHDDDDDDALYSAKRGIAIACRLSVCL